MIRVRLLLLACTLVATGAVACSNDDEGVSDEQPRAVCEGSGQGPGPELVLGADRTEGPEVMWSASVGDVDEDADEIDGIAVDDDANTAISGVFRAAVNIGDETFESRGEGDIFVASFDPQGAVRWTKHFGGSGDDNTFDVKVDGTGNIHLSGWFAGTVDFGGVELVATGPQEMFVAKLSPDGQTLWARSFGGPGGAGGNEIAVLPDGEIAVSAMSAGDLVVDDVTYPFGGGSRDAFVLRMGPDGDVRWVHHFDGRGADRIRAIAIAEDGAVAVGFEFRNQLRSGDTVLESRGDWDGGLARLTPEGDLDWILPVGGAGFDNTRGAGFAPDGSIYASGVIAGAVFLFDRDIPAIGGRGDDYLAKVTPQGEPEWFVTMGGPGRAAGAELQANGDGVVVSAALEGVVTLRRDTDVITELEPPTEMPTSYLAAFDPDGNLRFVWTPTAQPPDGGALGDVLGVSFNGEYLVQALRYRGTLSIDGTEHTTASDRDSAVVFTCLHGT